MGIADKLLETARSALGTPYVWGGNSLASGVDCSGLVQQVFARHGFSLPRTTYQQIDVGHAVSQPKKLRPGDLVFFDTDRSHKGPDHVGIYMGDGKFIHAPRPGASVKISSLTDSYYMDRWMGGRRIQGVGAASDQYVEPEPVRRTASELAEEYGMSTAFFKSQPELNKLLKEAVKETWTPERFQASLKNTAWWKKNSETARQAQVLEKSDPATYRATMEGARAQAEKMAVELGAIVPSAQLSKLAKYMVHFGWEEAQVANFLGRFVKFTDEQTLGGVAGQAAKQISQQAYDLGIAVTEQSILNNAQYIVRGLTTMEKVQGSLREQAAGLYPAFAEQIKAGASVQDLITPYAQVMAQELGLNPNDVNAFNPRIKRAINRANDKGEPDPMSLTDFTVQVRDDPAWRKTTDAANKTMNIGRQVLRDMGLVS